MAPYTHFHNFSVHTHHHRPNGGRHYRAVRRRQRPWRIAFILVAVAYVGLQVLNPILLVPVAQSCAEDAVGDFFLGLALGGSGTSEEMLMKRCWWIILPAAAASVTSPFSIWEWVRHSFGSADGPDVSRSASGSPHQPDPWATNSPRNQRVRIVELPTPTGVASSPRSHEWESSRIPSGIQWVTTPEVTPDGILTLSVSFGPNDFVTLPGAGGQEGATNVRLTDGANHLYGSVIPRFAHQTAAPDQWLADKYLNTGRGLTVVASIPPSVAAQPDLHLCLWTGGQPSLDRLLGCVPVDGP